MNIAIKTVKGDFIDIHNVDSIKERCIDNERILECIGLYTNLDDHADDIYVLSVEVNGCYISLYNRYYIIRPASCEHIKIY